MIKLVLINIVVGYLVIKSLIVKNEMPSGLYVTEAEAGPLLSMVEELRKKIKTPKIHHIVVDGSYNAYVTTFYKFGFFTPSKNILVVGLPLMFINKGRTTALFTILAIFLLTAGCENIPATGSATSQITSPPTEQENKTIIDWVDFLKLNGISYTYSWQAALTDPSMLGDEISKIAFQVADNVNDVHYATKDGDAAFLPIGTVVYAIKDYPNGEIVAVQDFHAIGGYKLYVEEDKKNKLGLTFEEAVQNKIIKAAFYPMGGEETPILELKNGSQTFLMDLLHRAAQEPTVDINQEVANSVYYSFVMDTGAAIGYVDRIYRNGNKYYWNHPEAKELPSAFSYYFANERDVVFTIQGMGFPLPNHTDTVATGERIKRDSGINNITLIADDRVTERSLFTQETIVQLWGKAKEINPSDGENKVYLYMADRAMPVSNGQLIAYVTNKDTVVKRGNEGAFNVKLIHLDGTGDRTIVEGAKYGRNVILLDSVGDRIIAEGGEHSLLDINISNGKIRHFPINGMLDALSKDGRYVLYRKMASESQVGTEIAVFDLDTEKSIDLGSIPKNYVFSQGVK
ncbi:MULTISPECIES: hypothetical protein [unclassified Paenibacillus]|uniref:hypothetical protein n=1 Tax=unclassified Paenibacillus TaxID=185978 RepID=UPI002782AE93|nr:MULTISPECIES: hypothetical protein [unclassified Paenibacillus]MDQ0897653.1 hypothetical protein [Paenibacillus sp. V4I7]MDQ0916340.1 hypothetical protein [Paenibacillus sp. V4I5]